MIAELQKTPEESLAGFFAERTGELPIPFEDGEIDEFFPQEKKDALHKADQWLLDAYASRKDSSIENGLIFSCCSKAIGDVSESVPLYQLSCKSAK